METVVFGGVPYVRAADAAERFKYTNDYVGQLCRDKKVDARLVGRAWYVNVDSITEYRQRKHAKRRAKRDEKKRNKTLDKADTARIKVYAADRAKAIKIRTQPEIRPQPTKPNHRIVYQPDEADLLPRISEQRLTSVQLQPKVNDDTATKVRLDKRPSVTIEVRSNESKVRPKLVAEPLPEVSLKGKLMVDEAPDIEPIDFDLEAEKSTPTLDEKSIKKTSKIVVFLLLLLKPVLWPLKVLYRILRWVTTPVRKLLVKVNNVLKTLWLLVARRFQKKIATKSDITSFSPRMLESKPVSAVHDRVRFWSLLVSAVLTALLVLMIGAELNVLGAEVSQSVYFDRTVFARFIGLF